jgi:hypothetical protein
MATPCAERPGGATSRELNQELLISVKQCWSRHRSEIEHEPGARLEDIEWADGIAVGTPTGSATPRRSASCSSNVRVDEVFNAGENLTARSSPRHTGGPAWCAVSLATRPKRAPKPSSCSQLPADRASAHETKRLSDSDCVRTSRIEVAG